VLSFDSAELQVRLSWYEPGRLHRCFLLEPAPAALSVYSEVANVKKKSGLEATQRLVGTHHKENDITLNTNEARGPTHREGEREREEKERKTMK